MPAIFFEAVVLRRRSRKFVLMFSPTKQQIIADVQLDRFRQRSAGKGGICRTGLWRYSRHPNYFFEFLIWVSYSIFALSSATGVMDFLALLIVPITAYWFLVHFTGIPITELASLQRRGQDYADYCDETNRFFPWLPAKNVKGANRRHIEEWNP